MGSGVIEPSLLSMAMPTKAKDPNFQCSLVDQWPRYLAQGASLWPMGHV